MTVKRKPEQRKPWAGRFRQSMDPKVEAFTSSLAIDRRLIVSEARLIDSIRPVLQNEARSFGLRSVAV